MVFQDRSKTKQFAFNILSDEQKVKTGLNFNCIDSDKDEPQIGKTKKHIGEKILVKGDSGVEKSKKHNPSIGE